MNPCGIPDRLLDLLVPVCFPVPFEPVGNKRISLLLSISVPLCLTREELGMLLFLVEVSDMGMHLSPEVPGPCTIDVTSVAAPPPAAVTTNEIRVKYIDDVSMGEAVRLDTNLCSSRDRSGPREYHDRHGLVLPADNSVLQRQLNDIEVYTRNHEMMINARKTKIMPFNFTKKFDFLPQMSLNNGTLEVVYKA